MTDRAVNGGEGAIGTAPPDGTGARIVVAGDLVVDHHLYEGGGDRPGLYGNRGVRRVDRWGGAAGLAEAISALAGKTGADVSVRLEGPGDRLSAPPAHAYADWSPHAVGEGEPGLVWRARLLGFGEGGDTIPDPSPFEPSAGDRRVADVIVLEDADLGARYDTRLARLLADGGPSPSWIVLKSTTPVARGDLWNRLEGECLSKSVCVVSVDDLRTESAAISRGLSWERTVADLRHALGSDPSLKRICGARHLVVTLSLDGVLWVENPPGGPTRATLLFDPGGIEGRWAAGRPGSVPGKLTAFTAPLALWCAGNPGAARTESTGFLDALASGFESMRDLALHGHGRADPLRKPDGFPYARIADVAAGKRSYRDLAVCDVPWTDGARSIDDWTIVESVEVPPGIDTSRPVVGLARLLVTQGPGKALTGIPHAVFRRMTAVDRHEIEGLRGIQTLMRDYRANTGVGRPLSLGVFGPPGAGKSFGVKQLASELFGERSWLEFNLSQFDGPSDLMGPFHRGRDLALEGVVPVVLWDEFDAQRWTWLQYLIAPMQDGHFQEDQLTHATGRAVWIFAGGTSPTYAKFAANGKKGEATCEEFRLRKGPDFVSRLDGYFDVRGPNPFDADGSAGRPSTDRTYPLRRAQFIRNALAGPGPGRLDIDTDLLNALLLVPRYEHGSRSLEKLLSSLRGTGGAPIRRSALPPPRRLGMFVDEKAFARALARGAPFRTDDAVERQARAIHEAYLAQARERGDPVDPRIDMPFEELGVAEKKDNVAAAGRTIDVLALVGMTVARDDGGAVPRETYDALIEHNIERLAEAEHDGWMAHRAANGWVRGETRDFAARTHPCLKPYAELEDRYRRKDRMMVRDYRRRIDDAGLEIVWLGDQAPAGD